MSDSRVVVDETLGDSWAHRARIAADLFMHARGLPEKLGILRYTLRHLERVLLGTGPKRMNVRLRGRTYDVAVHGSELAVYWEIYVNRVYERVSGFTPGDSDVVLDGGANVGMFALRQARRGARVYAFEPNPEAFGRLEANARRNGLSDRITAFQCALGERPGRAGLIHLTGLPQTVVHPTAGDDVEVRTLDQVVQELGLKRIALLKLDVEGAEAEVLRGGRGILSLVDRVVMEYHTQDLLEQCRRVLEDAGLRQTHVEQFYAYFEAGEAERR